MSNMNSFSGLYDFGLRSRAKRIHNLETVMQRFFVGCFDAAPAVLQQEALARSIGPGPDFARRLHEEQEFCEDGFGPQLDPPSSMIEQLFCDYAHTEPGAQVLARLLEWDDVFIRKGWREPGGALTADGISAYGAGLWRPFRVASSGDGADTVTPSGVLLLPDLFEQKRYSTGDIADPLAILHHELKAHVLPLNDAAGLAPGRELELLCVRMESEMLRELDLPERRLHWSRDRGGKDHTLDERNEFYYRGLVRPDESGRLVRVSPESGRILGAARVEDGSRSQDNE